MTSGFHRSREERMIGGVCGGISAYLRIDPALVRIYFVLLAFMGGIGWLLYLILWAALPYEGGGAFASSATLRAGTIEMAAKAQELGDDVRWAATRPNPRIGVIVGGVLVAIGALALVRNLGFPFLGRLNADLIWPLLLIVGGVVLVLRLPRE